MKSKSYFIQKFPTNFDKIFNLFFIEKKQILEYNKSIKDSWDVRHPTFLNLHLLLWDSYIWRQMSSHQYRKVREQWKTETDMRLPT